MPIHSIPFEPSSQHTAPLVWYQNLGAVSFENRLYFVPSFKDEEEQLCLIVVDGTQIMRMPVSPLRDLWPNDNFFINIQYGAYIPLNQVRLVIMPLFILMCQERFKGVLRYVDEANISLRKLQLWIRTVLRRRKQLAVAMALHPRLGSGSALAVLGSDLTASIISLL